MQNSNKKEKKIEEYLTLKNKINSTTTKFIMFVDYKTHVRCFEWFNNDNKVSCLVDFLTNHLGINKYITLFYVKDNKKKVNEIIKQISNNEKKGYEKLGDGLIKDITSPRATIIYKIGK